MKRIAPLLLILSITVLFAACSTKKQDITVLRLNEVVHSIFYAPQYVALEKGFFLDEGLDVQISVGQGADKSMTALISNSAEIALLGTEAAIYVYNEGKENHAVSFAQLTQTPGNFLVSRKNESGFKWEDVRGRTIIGGRAGGMPQMILEYILRKNGIEPFEDVEIVNNLQFTSTAGAFVGGIGDYTAEFDPSAYAIEKEGKGYVVASLGTGIDKVPYTVYMATKNYVKDNPDNIQKFTNAVYRGLLWVNSHNAKEIAEVIAPQFPESHMTDLEFMIDRYKGQGTWKENPVFEEDGFWLLQDIMEAGGELSERVPYNDIVYNDFAKSAVENVK